MQQSATRLRCDPTDYARKQQEKRDRAKDLRDQRQRGFCSDEHTFAPKVNTRVPASPSSNREEQEASASSSSHPRSFEDTPIRPSKSHVSASRKEQPSPEDVPIRAAKRQPTTAAGAAAAGSRIPAPSSHRLRNNNDGDDEEEADALDALSKRFPKKKAPPPSPHADDYDPAPLEPEHDTLFREVKRATGKELDDLPIRKATAPAPGRHTGPCLRNSSCGCPQCQGTGGAAPAVISSTNFGGGSGMRAEPLVRRRQSRAPMPSDDDQYGQQPQSSSARSTGSQSDMENSLTLLKSKMSRRKSRSAPTNPSASLFVDKNPVSSARAAPSSMQQQRYPAPQQVPPRANAASRGTPPAEQQAAPQPPPRRSNPPVQPRKQQPRDDDEEEDGYDEPRRPPPISSGANQTNELDEYGDQQEELIQCGNCTRRFNANSLAKHQKVCEKVFTGQRKVFNMAAKRLEGTEAEKIAAKASKSGGGASKKAASSASEQALKAKANDWKSKSDMFRNAMKASRGVTKALKEGGPLPPMAPSAPDPSLIQCEHCSRRFNERAAERHIPFCREKNQRMGGGAGPPPKKSAPAPVAAAKPARAPARKK